MPNWTYNRIRCKTKADFGMLCAVTLNDAKDFDFNRIVPRPVALESTSSPAHRELIACVAYAIKPHSAKDIQLSIPELIDGLIRRYPDLKIYNDDMYNGFSDEYDNYQDHLIYDRDSVSHVITTRAIKSIIDASSMQPDKNQTYILNEIYASAGENVIHNLIEYGAIDWYTWSCENWGTKWNACNTHVNEENLEITFDTAWSPFNIDMLYKLARKLNIPLYYAYAEEQFSVFGGEIIVNRDGSIYDEGYYDSSDNPDELFRVASSIIDPDQETWRFDTTTQTIAERYCYDDESEFEKIPVLKGLTPYLETKFGEKTL